jgi:NADH:ubiquinone oxidoreductase subunit 6 (subunit J)
VQLLEQYIEFQHRDLYQIGLRLYTEQVALFAVITVALLAAMIAAIALTMPTMVLGSEKRVFSWARAV